MRKKIFITWVLFLSLSSLKSQSWGSLGVGLSNKPGLLKAINGKLYIAGANLAGGKTVKSIATFDGINFDSVGSGVCYGGINPIYRMGLEMYNNELYFSGGFEFSGDCSTWPWPVNERNIVRWDNTNWNPVVMGTAAGGFFVHDFEIYNGDLYAGGEFGSMGGINAVGVAKWNGTSWSAVGSCGAPFRVYDMDVYNGELYVVGDIGLTCVTGNTSYYNIAKWNGTKWDSVKGPANGPVTAMVVDTVNNYLYVGGAITNVAGVPCYAVARWDGTNWTSPGGFGITNGATSMCMFNNELYVGGYWTQGTQIDTVLARFDGTNWYQVIGPNTTVNALGVYDSNLYVGGYFTTVNSTPANYIACYGNSCPQGVGIKELNAQGLKFKVYPNPVKAELNILIDEKENEEYILKIYNSIGGKISILQVFQKGSVQVCNRAGKICHTEKIMIE